MYIEKLREINPKRAEIFEKLMLRKSKISQTETGKLLAEGLSEAKTLAEVRAAAKSVLPEVGE